MRKARRPSSERCGSGATVTDRFPSAQGCTAGFGVPPLPEPDPPPLDPLPPPVDPLPPPRPPPAPAPLDPVPPPAPPASALAVVGEEDGGTGREVVGAGGDDTGAGAVPSASVLVGCGPALVHPVSSSATDISAIVIQLPRARTGSVCRTCIRSHIPGDQGIGSCEPSMLRRPRTAPAGNSYRVRVHPAADS